MKMSTIKHKLWGKLKKKSHDTYEIVPVKDSELFNIKSKKYDWLGSNYTFEEAICWVEHYRAIEFKKLCYQALYERRKKRTKDL